MQRSTVSSLWNAPSATLPYATGVSLHSHTSYSRESLCFIYDLCAQRPLVRPLIEYFEGRAQRNHGVSFDFNAAHWRPPLVPRMAFDLEQSQIEALNLRPLVSITDHDDMQAPLLLRTLPTARHIPVSLEWTVSFGSTFFHLGVHNLPSVSALAWMNLLARYTEAPDPQTLHTLLHELHAEPAVLLVLNHPLWDLHKVGDTQHRADLHEFLSRYNHLIHALELNGLRHARENREVCTLAEQWNQLLISGGDRHGLEPNANINLTNATSFSEFVHEVRDERLSHVLFMPQYRRPWEHRLLQSTIEAISDHPHFGPGWQRWDDRAFHPDATGVTRSLAELWPDGYAPLLMRTVLAAVRLLHARPFAGGLGLIWPDTPVDVPELTRESSRSI